LLSHNAASWATVSQALVFTLEVDQVSEGILFELLDYSATWNRTDSSSVPGEEFDPSAHYIHDYGESSFYSNPSNTSPTHIPQAQTWGSPGGEPSEPSALPEDRFSQVAPGNVAAWIPITLDYTIGSGSWPDFGHL
jgi:hypothetical protein